MSRVFIVRRFALLAAACLVAGGLLGGCRPAPAVPGDAAATRASSVVESGAIIAARLRAQMEESRAYLIRMLDPRLGGAHKLYRPRTDALEPRLHVVYTSSVALTLLALAKDGDVPPEVRGAVDFLLRTQQTEDDARAGAFPYAVSLPAGTPEDRFVTGTTAKVIFTLLKLEDRTKEARALEAAKKGGDWLLTMIKADGGVKEEWKRREDGTWARSLKDSTLYNGQTLSALSRLFLRTGDERYRDGAAKIARYLMTKVEREGCYVGDDFRTPNPVSSTWILRSLIDYDRAQPDPAVRDLVLRCGDELLGRQIRDPSKKKRDGRWEDSLTTSGNGWIAEVLVSVLDYCREEGGKGCDRYRDAALRTAEWVLQHAYTAQTAASLPNPQRARGGIALGGGTDPAPEDVRTDAVCHALNAFAGLVKELEGT